jgi:AcrR family transcriptional regulator
MKRSRPGGRTARVTERVLEATVELIAQHGPAGVTYEAVAERSGASRATIYRKWPRREDLLRAALVRFAESSVVVSNTGDLRADVIAMLCMIGETLATPVGRAIISASMTADDDPMRKLSREVQQARHFGLQERLDSAVATGELPPLDSQFLYNMVFAPAYSFVVRDRVPFSRELAERIVDAVFDGMVPGPRKQAGSASFDR